MDFEAAYAHSEFDRWKHFNPPLKYPFHFCPDCKKKCLGVMIYSVRDESNEDDLIIHWANVVGSLVSEYSERDWSPDAPLIKELPREGPYFCWNCGRDKDAPLRQDREANFESMANTS